MSESLMEVVKESGAGFGMAVGRDENDQVVSVMVAALDERAVEIVATLERLQAKWEVEESA